MQGGSRNEKFHKSPVSTQEHNLFVPRTKESGSDATVMMVIGHTDDTTDFW